MDARNMVAGDRTAQDRSERDSGQDAPRGMGASARMGIIEEEATMSRHAQ